MVAGQDGSSPRTRGTGKRGTPKRLTTRFIPAHAGNRPAARMRHTTTSVHPRARGEQFLVAELALQIAGSSPRTRGTGRRRALSRCAGRFIPAHAGNSLLRGAPGAHLPVHPRARGEQEPVFTPGQCWYGSSPRTRGTELQGRGAVHYHRFIPAHAGNRAAAWPAPSGSTVHPRARGEQARR